MTASSWCNFVAVRMVVSTVDTPSLRYSLIAVMSWTTPFRDLSFPELREPGLVREMVRPTPIRTAQCVGREFLSAICRHGALGIWLRDWKTQKLLLCCLNCLVAAIQAGREIRILLAAGLTKETCGSGCDKTRHSDWAAVRAPRNRSHLQQKQNNAASSIAGAFLKCALPFLHHIVRNIDHPPPGRDLMDIGYSVSQFDRRGGALPEQATL